MSMTEYIYICVKGSLYGSDCAAFGLNEKEVLALQSRFPTTSSIEVVNGSYMKANPLQIINALSELGYEVVASSGSEAETTWTMKREVPVNMSRSHDVNDICCKGPSSSATQTLSEMDFERGIWSAALYKDLERVNKLIDGGIDVNAQDNAGYTALHYAARANHKDICMQLLKRGAFVNAVTKAGKASPLHRAATAGHEEIVHLLLSNGADPYLKDSDNLTAVDRAQKEGYENIVKIITDGYPDLAN